MIKKFFGVLGAFCVATTAGAQEVPKEEPIVLATRCMAASAVLLDDKQTSPEIIARGAASECSASLRALRTHLSIQSDAILGQRMDPLRKDEFVQKMYDGLRRGMEDLAIAQVLKQRVAARR